jgi:hypothetical protein
MRKIISNSASGSTVSITNIKAKRIGTDIEQGLAPLVIEIK